MTNGDSPYVEVLAHSLFRETNDAFFLFHPSEERVVDAAERSNGRRYIRAAGSQLWRGTKLVYK